MKNSTVEKKYDFLLTLGIIGLVMSGVWYITKEKKSYSNNRAINKEEIKQILISISNDVHPIMMDLSHMILSVKKSFNSGSMEHLKNVEVILSNGGFKEKIIEAQKNVLNRWKIGEEHFERALSSICKIDEEVSLLRLGIDLMYRDSIQGIYPLLPYLGNKIDFTKNFPIYTPEYIFEIYKRLNIEKERRLRLVIDDLGDPLKYTIRGSNFGAFPSEELSKRLEEANALSEDLILGSAEEKRIFSHAMALYSREEGFYLKRQQIEQEHSDNILNIIVNYNN
ncbi:hypothetical protein HWI79_419 [Cryptosporidium felis]|nr:hypothetical protein HWI79_419 [Cryptosporidium felis]